jgi:vanillate O-demethylase ferredoxin subunit
MRYRARWSGARVRSARQVAEEVRLLELEPEGGPVSYPPGSHLDVAIAPAGRREVRSYSLVGERATGGVYRVAVQRHAPGRGGSQLLWTLEPGARLDVSQPQSRFELRPDAPEHLLVAGGIGVTPLVSMAEMLTRVGARFRLLYAGRSRERMAFLGELSALLGDRLEPFVSGEGRRLDLAAQLARLDPDGQLAVCGPLRMLDQARRLWAAAGRPPERLRFETFGLTGRLAPRPFEVRVRDHGLSVVVPEDRTMLEALEAAGVEIMADCLRGECGVCAVDVVEVEGELDHRDVFLSDAEKGARTRICTCVSRAAGRLTVDTGFR